MKRGDALDPMITLEDCIALCGLTEEEVLAIAEHEHVPEMAARWRATFFPERMEPKKSAT